MTRFRGNTGGLYGGADVNVDRINLAIVDESGELRDIKTFWFEEASRKGCLRHRARGIIGMAIHKMLNYAYNHGVKALFLKNPDVLGRLRLMLIRSGERRHENYIYRIAVFRSSIIEMIAIKAPLYSIKVSYVNSKGTINSKEHDEITRKYELNKHTASACLIALKRTINHNKPNHNFAPCMHPRHWVCGPVLPGRRPNDASASRYGL